MSVAPKLLTKEDVFMKFCYKYPKSNALTNWFGNTIGRFLTKETIDECVDNPKEYAAIVEAIISKKPEAKVIRASRDLIIPSF
jgi:hypothetical protein